jgi:hypothetical protein
MRRKLATLAALVAGLVLLIGAGLLALARSAP